MTFNNERINLVEKSFDDEGYLTVVALDDALRSLDELEHVYAPTIEMTELQVAQMMSFKEVNVGFGTFIYKQGLGEVPAFKDWIQQDREDELMQAWLHPECIKVVKDVE